LFLRSQDGCGLKELTLLKNIILEISNNNSINPHFAFKKFCSDLKDQYDAKLGLQKKIDEMNTSLIHARQELHSISLEYSKLRELNNKLEELLITVFHKVILYVGTILSRDIQKICPV
jgi:hypothetical protein